MKKRMTYPTISPALFRLCKILKVFKTGVGGTSSLPELKVGETEGSGLHRTIVTTYNKPKTIFEFNACILTENLYKVLIQETWAL
jgi:hypothetical protein